MFTHERASNTERPEGDTIMTVAEVAALLRVHRSTVSRYAMSGELPSHKLGNRRLFKASDVRAFFDKRKVTGESGC